jgi:hypothetical protein
MFLGRQHKNSLKKSWKPAKSQRGQGMTEYILLLVVVIGIAFAFKGKILEVVRGKVETVGGEISGFNSN